MLFVPKTNWQDSPSTATPITAAELIRMENGIAEGARDASETQRGNVELATATEMDTGTDLGRVPSVKRVVDYVAAQITSVGGVTQAYVVGLVSAPFSLISTAIGMVPLTVKRISGQTANLVNIKDENEVVIASVDQNGQITAGGLFTGQGMFRALARNASTPLARLQMFLNQSANPVIVQDSTGTNKFTVGPDGMVNGANIGTPPGGGAGFTYSPMVVLDAAQVPPSTLLAGTIVLKRPAP